MSSIAHSPKKSIRKRPSSLQEQSLIAENLIADDLHAEKFVAIGKISGAIAHEVRNPLTNIMLALEQFRPILQKEESLLFIDIIQRNADRINDLVNRLLHSTRFESLTLEKYSIPNLLDETLQLAADRMKLKKIKLEKSYYSGSHPCEPLIDHEKLQTAFLNIINDAIEAMESGKGILQIQTSREEGKCIISISDNGKGISPEDLKHIFLPFFTTKPEGTGLGLSIAQKVVLNHGGSIKVQSEVGRGTTFLITLPSNCKLD